MLKLCVATRLLTRSSVFAVGELSGLIREGLLLAKKALPLSCIRNEVVVEDGARLFRLNAAVDSGIAPAIGEIASAASLLKEFVLAVNFGERPGATPPKGQAGTFSAALAAEIGLSPDVVRSGRSALFTNSREFYFLRTSIFLGRTSDRLRHIDRSFACSWRA